MGQYIDKSALVAEIEKLEKLYCYGKSDGMLIAKSIFGSIKNNINVQEVKEVDLELITGWFDHIAQIADDRMTLTNQKMTDAHALDEIKCLAKNSSEFITKHYKAQKGE